MKLNQTMGKEVCRLLSADACTPLQVREGRAICPACGGRTQVVIQTDTVLINFPLFCKKCKKTTLVEYGKSLSQRA